MGDDDRWMFLRTLGEMAGRTGIRVHAYALMDNHYHLVIETPKANLVAGMTWFQTAYTLRFNAKNGLWGHLYGGRYIERLETLVDWSEPTEAGKVLWEGQSLQSTLRRGWYFGSQAFREKLLDRLGRDGLEAGRKTRKRYSQAELKDHDRDTARRIVTAGLECTGLQGEDLSSLRKNDQRKALIAHVLMERTSVPQKWIVDQLAMGSAPYVSRLAKEMGERIAAGDRAMKRLKKAIVARIIT